MAVVHIDFTQPYDPQLRQVLLEAARDAGQDVIDGGVYAAMQGPRPKRPRKSTASSAMAPTSSA